MNGEFRIAGWLLLLLLAPSLQTLAPALHAQQVSAIHYSPFIIQNSLPPKSGREFWALVVVDKGLRVLDIESTQRWKNRDPSFHELNPLLPRRPSRGRMYAQSMAAGLFEDFVDCRLRRAGHPNWARAVRVISFGLEAWCIQHNLRHTPRGNSEF